MLGHRGCRLGITYPEITEMQARAIFEAAVLVAKKGIKVIPEVMIPLIGGVKELENQKKIVVAVAEEVLGKAGLPDLKYLVGTMIEIPRAALTAGDVAKEADFFSFGTNDLTQTDHQGLSRDDYTKGFQPDYQERRESSCHARPVRRPCDQEGVGQLVKMAVRARPQASRPEPGSQPASAAESTAASPARCSSAIAWAWTTCPAPRSASQSPAWQPRRRPSPAIRRTSAHRVGVQAGQEQVSRPPPKPVRSVEEHRGNRNKTARCPRPRQVPPFSLAPMVWWSERSMSTNPKAFLTPNSISK